MDWQGGMQMMGEDAVKEESKSFALRLLRVGDKRIAVIKAIRMASGIGLKEAMALETAVRGGDYRVVVEGSFEKVGRAGLLFSEIGSGAVVEICKASEVADRERQLSDTERLLSHIRMARDLASKQDRRRLESMLNGVLTSLEGEGG
jgi:archaeosine-15-forming tRNA-guanine transglycosylase